jgi:hypothetical protein
MSFLVVYLDWILATLGLYGQYITFVKKAWWAPWLGLGSQAGWITYAITRSDYGLIFLCIGSGSILIMAIRKDERLHLVPMIRENAKKNRLLKRFFVPCA